MVQNKKRIGGPKGQKNDHHEKNGLSSFCLGGFFMGMYAGMPAKR
jgi:hypothetical protein